VAFLNLLLLLSKETLFFLIAAIQVPPTFLGAGRSGGLEPPAYSEPG
jgi:hypothetical protein